MLSCAVACRGVACREVREQLLFKSIHRDETSKHNHPCTVTPAAARTPSPFPSAAVLSSTPAAKWPLVLSSRHNLSWLPPPP